MSENNFNSDLDAILAEFASYSSSISGGDARPEAAPPVRRPRSEPVEYAAAAAPVVEKAEEILVLI